MLHKHHDTDNLKQWLQPWDVKVHNDLQHDDRFFSLVMKAFLAYMDSTIRLYGKNIRHFIVSTGTEYLYQESNGYEYSMNLTTGEDYIYMEKPRCTCSWQSLEVMTNEISSPYSRGQYERACINEQGSIEHRAFSAEIKILPVKIPITLTYTLANFNESLILTQELLTIFSFTRYFSFSYLGVKIDCSLEFPFSYTPTKQIKTDYNAESKNRQLEISLDLKTSFPVIMDQTEIPASKVIDVTCTILQTKFDRDIRLSVHDEDVETNAMNNTDQYSFNIGISKDEYTVLSKMLEEEFPDIYEEALSLYSETEMRSRVAQLYRKAVYDSLGDIPEEEKDLEYLKEIQYLYREVQNLIREKNNKEDISDKEIKKNRINLLDVYRRFGVSEETVLRMGDRIPILENKIKLNNVNL